MNMSERLDPGQIGAVGLHFNLPTPTPGRQHMLRFHRSK